MGWTARALAQTELLLYPWGSELSVPPVKGFDCLAYCIGRPNSEMGRLKCLFPSVRLPLNLALVVAGTATAPDWSANPMQPAAPRGDVSQVVGVQLGKALRQGFVRQFGWRRARPRRYHAACRPS